MQSHLSAQASQFVVCNEGQSAGFVVNHMQTPLFSRLGSGNDDGIEGFGIDTEIELWLEGQRIRPGVEIQGRRYRHITLSHLKHPV